MTGPAHTAPRTVIANVEMAREWDGDEGDDWTENADRYDATDRYIFDTFMAAVAIAEIDDVLDIGCGTGKSTRAAALAARHGRVLGVDLSSRMLQHARSRAAADGQHNICYLQADAQVYPFEAQSFDVCISVFGAMFFNDPSAAFTNINTALRPGGRLALVAWRRFEDNDWLRTIVSELAAGRDLPTPQPGQPGPFGLADARQARDVLSAAGFASIHTAALDAPMWLGADPDDAWSFVSDMGIVRGLTAELDDQTRDTALARLRTAIGERDGPDGVVVGAAEWLITAATPA